MEIYRDIYIKSILKRGRGIAAELIFREILLKIKMERKAKALDIFDKAVEKVPPLFYYKKLTLGGVTYNVPVTIFEHKQLLFSALWVLSLAKKREIKSFKKEVATILMETNDNTGPALERRAQWHTLGLENRMFVRFLK
jgi:ribosomal protein S7